MIRPPRPSRTRHARARSALALALAAALGAAGAGAGAAQEARPALSIALVGVLGQQAQPGFNAGAGASGGASGGVIVLPAAAAAATAAPATAATAAPATAATAAPATAAAAADPAAGAVAALAVAPVARPPIVLSAAAAAAAPEPAAEAPAAEAGPRVERAAAAPAAPEPQPAPAPAAVAPLWPVDGARAANGRAQFRGERDGLDFALFVPPGAAPRALTLAAVSSAFIMPQRSVIRAFLGEELIGEAPLRSITGLETIRLPLAPGRLAAGFNVVRIEVDLAHRLYCGAEASYSLWTELDLAASGAEIAPGPAPAGAEAFLAAAAAARAAGAPIAVRGPAELAAGSAELAQAAAQLGAVMGPGLAFAAAGPDGAAAVIELRGAGAPGVAFHAEPDGAQTLAIGPGLGLPPGLFGTRGLAGATADLPTPPLDAPAPLAALGYRTTQISEHLWTDAVAFALPRDWLMAVKERATLHLDFAYLSGIPAGAELRVRVNGAAVRIVPLDRGGRFDAAPLEVRFDAGLLRAGRNLLGFELAVPGAPADQPCLAADAGRIEIRDASTLFVPSAPKMHMPGLGRWLASEAPLRIEAAARGPAAAGRSDPAAGLGIAAALAGGGGATSGDGARRLVILPASELGQASFGDFGIGRQVMLAAIQPPRPAEPAPPPQADPPPPPAAATPGGPRPDVLEAGVLGGAPDGLGTLGARLTASARRLALPDPVTELADWIGETRAQALLFQLDPATPDDAHLLVANEARPEAVAAALARARGFGVPLDGHVALLTWDGEWLTWRDRTRLPVLEEALDPGNWRGVIGNFASARPRVFVLALIAVALISVLLANSYVAASRRQR